MSELDRYPRSNAGPNDSLLPYPDDFSPDETAFARALRECFPIEDEELPPLFIQTLIEDDLHAPAAAGFEQKLTYRVFRRLSLPRPSLLAALQPTAPKRSPWRTFAGAPGRTARPLAALVAVLLIAMMVSVVMASPSFAAGLRILLGQTGVVAVEHYPQPITLKVGTARGGARQVQLDPNMPLFWLGPATGNYLYSGVRPQEAQAWSKGSIADLQYVLPGPSRGTGLLDIREFQIADAYSEVLQVVQSDSATAVTLNDGQNTPAVYIDGGWFRDGSDHVWQSGTRSELIFERGGVIVWMVGDQRDGMGMSQLVAAASHAMVMSRPMLMPRSLNVNLIGQDLASSFRDPLGTEVYETVLRGSSSEDTGVNQFVVMNPAPAVTNSPGGDH